MDRDELAIQMYGKPADQLAPHQQESVLNRFISHIYDAHPEVWSEEPTPEEVRDMARRAG